MSLSFESGWPIQASDLKDLPADVGFGKEQNRTSLQNFRCPVQASRMLTQVAGSNANDMPEYLCPMTHF